MARFLDVVRSFFNRATPITPEADGLLHGALNAAHRNELFYAELIEDKWDESRGERFRNYPWPPGWQG